MINTLIFDFGDVFINLDKRGAMDHALKLFNIDEFSNDMLQANIDFETGKICSQEFLNFYESKFQFLNHEEIVEAWNYIIKDFPKYRLEFLQNLKASGRFKLILLSNTNALHIEYVKQSVPFFKSFKSCFDAFYLSHEIHLRKPNKEIFSRCLSSFSSFSFFFSLLNT